MHSKAHSNLGLAIQIGDKPDLTLYQYPRGHLQRQALIGEYKILVAELRPSNLSGRQTCVGVKFGGHAFGRLAFKS